MVRSTGLDHQDFEAEQYRISPLEPSRAMEDPAFYYSFAVIDMDSKEVLRVYVYSEWENEMLSLPAQAMDQKASFAQLREHCKPVQSSKRVYLEFPRLYRWQT